MIWLGQNLKNRVLLAQHRELRAAPILVSLGDAFLRPSLKDRFFTERLRESLGMEGPIMVDSGGFALMSRRHLRCSIHEVRQTYEKLPADVLVSLDYPPSPRDDWETKSRLRRRTLRNLEVLQKAIPPERLMPVVHGHNVRELTRACEDTRKLVGESHLIGVGGLVPLLCSGGLVSRFCYARKDGSNGDREHWIADALEIVREYFPRSLIHVFGLGSATTAIAVLALGADSVDSLSWRRAANYGAILLPGRSERFPTFRRSRVPSRPVLPEQDMPVLAACKCPCCIVSPSVERRLSALANCYKHRAVHNAWTVLSEVVALRDAIWHGREVEFLKSRLSARHRLYTVVIEKLKVSEMVPSSVDARP